MSAGLCKFCLDPATGDGGMGAYCARCAALADEMVEAIGGDALIAEIVRTAESGGDPGQLVVDVVRAALGAIDDDRGGK